MRLQGKVALVTGGGRGIGRAIVMVFAREGADVAIADIDLTIAEKTAGEVRQLGRRAIAIKVDVGEPSDVDMMADRVINELGGVHVLVNNAGIPDERKPTTESSVDIFDEVIRVNLRGTYLCCRRVGKWMVSHKTGKVINIGSIGGMSGHAPRPAYGPAKAAIIHLTRCLAVEWGEYNINVNCVSPGFVMSPMLEERMKKEKIGGNVFERIVPLGRLVKPEEIADAVLFLASDEASCISGVTIPVDGGYMASGFVRGPVQEFIKKLQG